MNKKTIIWGSIVLGIIFLGLAIFYFVTPANHLPHFLPGYDASVTKAHFKHGIASLILGLGLFVLAWFQSGKKSSK